MTDRGRALSFLAVGPQKTATTWLDRCLREHPELRLPQASKETFFFDRYFDRGIDWYWKQFGGERTEGVFGEVGPSYFHEPEAIERVGRCFPSARVIVTLRDPAERAFSLFLHHRRKGRVPADFWRAVERQPAILDASRYAVHIPRWWNAVGKDGVLLLMNEDVEANPQQVLATTWEFLGVGPLAAPRIAEERTYTRSLPSSTFVASIATRVAERLRKRGLHRIVAWGRAAGLGRVYSGGAVPAIDRDLHDQLARTFAKDIEFVEGVIGRRLDSWR